MDSYHIWGGIPLEGEAVVSGAKNAALPILAAAVLAEGESRICRCPDLTDINSMMEILKLLGCRVRRVGGDVEVDSRGLRSSDIPEEWMRSMRSSVFLLGPLLARTGEAILRFPGGCQIGARPIDIHLKGLEALGADICRDGDRLICRIHRSRSSGTGGSRLKGTRIVLPYPSVGATENLMMAAVMAEGETCLVGAAREPEIIDLQDYLNRCGGDVSGAGTHEICIQGRRHLHGAVHRVIPDRIEAGTLLLAAAVTGGRIELKGAQLPHLSGFLDVLQKTGCRIRIENKGRRSDNLNSFGGCPISGSDPLGDIRIDSVLPRSPRNTDETGESIEFGGADIIRLQAPTRLCAVPEIITAPWPGFSTDLQSPFLAAMVLARGTCTITETVFENRFKEVEELHKMGAKIEISGHTARIEGTEQLRGARVKADDLRGGAALVLAGLAAKEKTIVENICHIDRGYDKFNLVLQKLGARIKRESIGQKGE